MKILLDSKQFTIKPTSQDAARLTKSLTKSEVEISPYDAVIAIGSRGQTFCPALMLDPKKPRSRANWKSQTLFCLDFDNGGSDLLLPNDAIAIYQKAKLSPLACYETFSSSPALPKFRLMFLLENAVFDYEEAKFIVNGLTYIMKGYDSLDAGVGRDLSRLFYGGKKLLYYDYDETYLELLNLPLLQTTYGASPKAQMKDLDKLAVTEIEDLQKLIKGVKKAIADPLKRNKAVGFNKLQKGNRYGTLLHAVNWLMTMSPLALTKDKVFEIVLEIIDDNREEWYDIKWDLEEKLSFIYDWCEGNGD